MQIAGAWKGESSSPVLGCFPVLFLASSWGSSDDVSVDRCGNESAIHQNRRRTRHDGTKLDRRKVSAQPSLMNCCWSLCRLQHLSEYGTPAPPHQLARCQPWRHEQTAPLHALRRAKNINAPKYTATVVAFTPISSHWRTGNTAHSPISVRLGGVLSVKFDAAPAGRLAISPRLPRAQSCATPGRALVLTAHGAQQQQQQQAGWQLV